MSKKNVLKSLLAMVMVGFILSLSSCQKDEKKIIGVWKYDKVELEEFSCSNPAMTAIVKPFVKQNLGLSTMFVAEIEFTKDGKMITRTMFGESAANYSVNDKRIIITSEGEAATCGISFPNKKTMQWNASASKYELEQLSFTLSEEFEEDVEVTKCIYRIILTKK